MVTGQEVEDLFAGNWSWHGYYDPTGRFLLSGREDGLYVVDVTTY
ncbi:MAG: hypothetical protein P8Y72_09320 [Anaerolineales bacterium]